MLHAFSSAHDTHIQIIDMCIIQYTHSQLYDNNHAVFQAYTSRILAQYPFAMDFILIWGSGPMALMQ